MTAQKDITKRPMRVGDYFLRNKRRVYVPTKVIAALHEAGHAVVAAHLRVPFSNVTIVPSGSLHGRRTDFLPVRTRFRAFKQLRNGGFVKNDVNGEFKIVWEKNLLATIAGVGAEGLCYHIDVPECFKEGTGKFDWQQARKIAEVTLDIPARERDAYLYRLFDKVEQIVQINYIRRAIWIVADDLLERQTLTAQSVRSVYRDCRDISKQIRN